MAVSELEQYRQAFAEIRQQAADVTAGLDEPRFNWRPAADAWSIEECLAHLTSVGVWEMQAIETAIDDARARGITGAGPFTFGAIDRTIIRLTEPPVRLKLETPRKWTPIHGQPLTAILPTFNHVQSTLILLTERAEGLDLRRVKVATPISGLIKMSLGAMFAQIAAHERRHLAQAQRVRSMMPGAPLPATALAAR